MQMKSILAGAALALMSTTAAFAGDVRIMWYSDGVEGDVMKDLVGRFMKENPGINVILDNVAYSVIKEQLPVQLEAGNGPDIARVTAIKDLSKHWLDLRPLVKDAKYWDENYGAQADWMRPDGSNQISGFMTQITLTGGFANKTLFEQAGVPLPGPKATWEEWAAASKKVADSQKIFAMAIDRSGHRLTAPLLSYGANYVGKDGKPAPLDKGAKDFMTKFVGWVADGSFSKDVWVSAAGSTYRAAADDFINGQLAFYYSGSWQVANLATKIGNNFDWVATGSPCGPAACTGMPGGAALVAVKYTKNPKEVAAVMDWFAQEKIVKEFSERTLFLPGNKAVVDKGGLDFKTNNAQAKAALTKYVEATKSTSETALKLPGWRWSDTVYAAIVTRVGQTLAGEMKIEDAFARIDADIAQKVKDAGQ